MVQRSGHWSYLFPASLPPPHRYLLSWLLLSLISFAYFWTLCTWNHIVRTLLNLAFSAQPFFFDPSLFSPIVGCSSNASIYLSVWYSIVWIYHLLFSHSTVDGRFNCFQFLTIKNIANTNILACLLLQTWSHFCRTWEIVGSWGTHSAKP